MRSGCRRVSPKLKLLLQYPLLLARRTGRILWGWLGLCMLVVLMVYYKGKDAIMGKRD